MSFLSFGNHGEIVPFQLFLNILDYCPYSLLDFEIQLTSKPIRYAGFTFFRGVFPEIVFFVLVLA